MYTLYITPADKFDKEANDLEKEFNKTLNNRELKPEEETDTWQDTADKLAATLTS